VVELPEISAVAFTGSQAGGLALAERARQRKVPVPVFAEMGSTNPAIVTPAASAARGDELAGVLADAVLNSAGQLCTKPGLILLPATDPGTELSLELARRVRSATPGPMLSDTIQAGYERAAAAVDETPGVEAREEEEGAPAPSEGQALPSIWETTVEAACRESRLRGEVFGPAAIVVRYKDESELFELLEALEGQLSFSIFSEGTETDLLTRMIAPVAARAGRIVFDSPTTGVSVAMAQHHGGPYPATLDDSYTSVGGTAAERFVRPVAFQDCPAGLLPEALRNDNPFGILRSVNGTSTRDAITTA